MKKNITIVIAILILIFSLNNHINAAEKELKIGAVLPLSGPAAPWGVFIKNGIEMRIDELGKTLKIKNDSFTIKMVYEDDGGGSPIKAKTATEKLAFKDKVKYLVGPLFAGEMRVMLPILKDAKIITLAYTMYPKRYESPYTFGFIPGFEYTIPLYVKVIKENYPEVQKWAFVQPNDETGHINAPNYEKGCKAVGIDYITELYERGTQDFYPLLTRLLARKPDVLSGPWSDGEAGMIIKQAREMGYKGLIYDINPHSPASIIKIAGEKNAEGFMFPSIPKEGPLSPEGIKDFEKKYSDKYNTTAGLEIALLAYDSVAMLFAAMEKSQNIEVDNVLKSLEGMIYQGVQGKNRFGGSKIYGVSHQIVKPEILSQIQGQKVVGKFALTPEMILDIIGE